MQNPLEIFKLSIWFSDVLGVEDENIFFQEWIKNFQTENGFHSVVFFYFSFWNSELARVQWGWTQKNIVRKTILHQLSPTN